MEARLVLLDQVVVGLAAIEALGAPGERVDLVDGVVAALARRERHPLAPAPPTPKVVVDREVVVVPVAQRRHLRGVARRDLVDEHERAGEVDLGAGPVGAGEVEAEWAAVEDHDDIGVGRVETGCQLVGRDGFEERGDVGRDLDGRERQAAAVVSLGEGVATEWLVPLADHEERALADVRDRLTVVEGELALGDVDAHGGDAEGEHVTPPLGAHERVAPEAAALGPLLERVVRVLPLAGTVDGCAQRRQTEPVELDGEAVGRRPRRRRVLDDVPAILVGQWLVGVREVPRRIEDRAASSRTAGRTPTPPARRAWAAGSVMPRWRSVASARDRCARRSRSEPGG